MAVPTPEPDAARAERMVIVGGSSGMGLALAAAALGSGAEVTIASRSRDKLAAAARQLAGKGTLRTVAADVTREKDVERLFAATGELDHLVTTAVDGAGAYQPVASFDPAAARNLIDTKLVGCVLLAKHAAPLLRPGGSITFTSGIAAYRPGVRGSSMVSALNGALASLAYALAVELAPVRVNVVSPGWVETPIWDVIAGDAKAETLDAMAQRLPVGRVGRPEDIAEAFLALARNPFITGTVLHADGGQRLV